MTRGLGKIIAGVALWLGLLVALIYAADFGRIRGLPGVQTLRAVQFCPTADCVAARTVPLPYFSPVRLDAAPEVRHLRVTLTRPAPEQGPQALYFPKLSDNLDIAINGQLVRQNDLPRRLWNIPLLVPLPDALLGAGASTLDLTLYGPPPEGIDLQPFYFGPIDKLRPAYMWRSFLGPELAQFGLGLMVVLAAALLTVWAFRRHEREYLWLGLSCVAALPILVHFGLGTPVGGYKIWTILWVLAISLYVLMILKFLRPLVDFTILWPERLHSWTLAFGTLAILTLPARYVFHATFALNIVLTAPLACIVLVLIWLYRARLSPVDFGIFFVCLSLSVALGIYGLYLELAFAPARSMALFHLMPLIMSLACLWLILSRLIRSLSGYERLTATLNETIAQKSAKLEESFARLSESRHREAISRERDRIMLDLHDGIGGQLVSLLAYMHNNGIGDRRLEEGLEEALRDLALMLDSLENHDSLVTLLGMLRTRLEGLLSENGIEFDWQVHGEPELADPGPSQSLHLARIVQEAITNVIKHAGADTITVYVDEREIRISDNGRGFDGRAQQRAPNPSHGISNMRRRSALIGAEFRLESSPKGTVISLILPGNG